MTTQSNTLGFLGIGLMGQPMTLRLLQAGFEVNVWNRSPEKLAVVQAAGAKVFADIQDVVNASDIILLCLADTAVVQALVEQHFLAETIADKLIIDLSSIDPQATRDLAAKVQAAGGRWLDAPVSGGVAGAEQGTLAIMAGGSDSDIAIAREVLAPLYQQLTHMGPVGSGQVTKICNQMIVSCNMLVIAEMMALAKQAGVAAEKIPQALAGGFADSKPLQIAGVEMAVGRFEPVKWRVKTLLKDLSLAQTLAKANGSAIPMSALAQQLLQLHGSQGYLEQDPATLIKLYRQNSC